MKTFRAIPVLALCASFATSTVLRAGCVGSDRDPYSTVAAIQLVPVSWPSNLVHAVGNAMAMWNDSGCNTGGTAFPRFQDTSAGAGRVLKVNYRTGLNPNNVYSCGHFIGNEVNVYTQVREPADNRLMSCGGADLLAETIAHELGHVLGLTDQFSSSCYGWIMSQSVLRPDGLTFRRRSVQPAECQQADINNLPPPPPPTSAPDSDPSNPDEDTNIPEQEDPLDCCSSPIVLDLGKAGFEFTDKADGVWFDLNFDSVPEHTAWTAPGAGDAFLVLDRDNDGMISSGAELFGDATEQAPSPTPNGFRALALFDERSLGGDEDGQITPADVIYPFLRLWIDADHDGASQSAELSTLADQGIKAIFLHYNESRRRDRYGNEIRYLAKVLLRDRRPGQTQAVDVFFVQEYGSGRPH